MRKKLYLCSRIDLFFITESFVLACVVKRGRIFFCFFFPFLCCKTDKKSKKNTQKCKKMKKNAKNCKKNLHISKKSCTFAPNLKNNQKKQPNK